MGLKFTGAVLTTLPRLAASLSLQRIPSYKSFISNLQQYFHASQLPSALHYYLSACCCCGSTRGPCRFGNYRLSSGCTYGFRYRLFPLHPCRGLFRCRFGSCSARAFAPVSLALLPCSINSCLLAGIASARPSALVDGAGFEPAVEWGADIPHLLPGA